ncbi:hypothetical protein CYMTET_34319 [Cymbomonas tetramitiformis]|uniref:Uncharacterized protein n=1 Tax=Cymbomonas tetramitiformis TaxID=36881 RepID=A0AAE0KQA9_9CHLO|nr:hypothetical protein CYMTET_34319 [Cymbomonas tetramitiformis]
MAGGAAVSETVPTALAEVEEDVEVEVTDIARTAGGTFKKNWGKREPAAQQDLSSTTRGEMRLSQLEKEAQTLRDQNTSFISTVNTLNETVKGLQEECSALKKKKAQCNSLRKEDRPLLSALEKDIKQEIPEAIRTQVLSKLFHRKAYRPTLVEAAARG